MLQSDVEPSFGRVVEIAASGKRFAAKFDDGKVRAWDHTLWGLRAGHFAGLAESECWCQTSVDEAVAPVHRMVRHFAALAECGTSLDEAFAPVQRMCRPLELIRKRTLAETLRLTLNDRNTLTDFCLLVGGQRIWTHKTILMQRCPYFHAMLQPHWLESKKDVFVIRQFSYKSFYEFIKYLYMGCCDLRMDGLAEVADFYGHPELRLHCWPRGSAERISDAFDTLKSLIKCYARQRNVRIETNHWHAPIKPTSTN